MIYHKLYHYHHPTSVFGNCIPRDWQVVCVCVCVFTTCRVMITVSNIFRVVLYVHVRSASLQIRSAFYSLPSDLSWLFSIGPCLAQQR